MARRACTRGNVSGGRVASASRVPVSVARTGPARVESIRMVSKRARVSRKVGVVSKGCASTTADQAPPSERASAVRSTRPSWREMSAQAVSTRTPATSVESTSREPVARRAAGAKPRPSSRTRAWMSLRGRPVRTAARFSPPTRSVSTRQVGASPKGRARPTSSSTPAGARARARPVSVPSRIRNDTLPESTSSSCQVACSMRRSASATVRSG